MKMILENLRQHDQLSKWSSDTHVLYVQSACTNLLRRREELAHLTMEAKDETMQLIFIHDALKNQLNKLETEYESQSATAYVPGPMHY